MVLLLTLILEVVRMDEKKSFKVENLRKVRAIEVKSPKTVGKLLSEMADTGFQGRKLAEAVEVLEKMISDPSVSIFLGYAGSLSTSGQWKIVNWFMENNLVDLLIPTGANISEDIVEAMGNFYYKGSHKCDDTELLKNNVNRYYDVYGRELDYLDMTDVIADFIMTLDRNHQYSSREFLYLFGKWLVKSKINSIVAIAAKHEVPIFCPAIADSPYGDAALVAKSKGFNLVIDAMKDYVEFMNLSRFVKSTGVVYVGGGVPKDFIQLFAVTANLLFPRREIPGRESNVVRFAENGEVLETYYPHKYAVQITTDSPQWGGLSGCTFEEAVSWGKIDYSGNYVQCYCDATIALPIIAHALAERIGKKKRKPRRFAKKY